MQKACWALDMAVHEAENQVSSQNPTGAPSSQSGVVGGAVRALVIHEVELCTARLTAVVAQHLLRSISGAHLHRP